MSTRRLFWASLALLTLLTGCQSGKPGSSPTAANSKKAAQPTDAAAAKQLWDLPDTDKPMTADQRPSPDVLAQKANEYAKSLEPFLAKRAAANAQPAAASSHDAINSAEPSGVHFNEVPGRRTAGPTTNPAQPVDAPTTNPAVSITPTVQPSPAVSQTPPRTEVAFNKDTPAVNTPLIVGQPRPLPPTDDLAHAFAQQVKDYPQDVAGQLDWQLFQFLQGQSVPQLQSLAPLPGEDREMLSAVLDGLTNFRNGLRADSNMLLSRKIRPLLELSDRLRAQAELTVPTLALCTDVKGFGVYEPIDPARFEAGKEHRVIVYCEVENFASLLDEQKRWQTKLTQEVVLYTEQNGLEVWRDKAPAHPIIDYSRNRRHDFFIVKMIRLPANLTIGRYLLKVTVVDQQVNRVAENTAPLVMVAE